MPWETFIMDIKESYDTLECDGQEVHMQEQKVQMLFNRIRVTSILAESFRMTLNSLKDKDRADSNLDEYCTALSTKLIDLKAEKAMQTGFSRDHNYREISQVGSKRGGHGRRTMTAGCPEAVVEEAGMAEVAAVDKDVAEEAEEAVVMITPAL